MLKPVFKHGCHYSVVKPGMRQLTHSFTNHIHMCMYIYIFITYRVPGPVLTLGMYL